jgi:subtilisin family serine protease
MNKKTLLFLVILLSAFGIYAQINSEDGTSRISSQNGAVNSMVLGAGGTQVNNVDMTEMIDIIVEFREVPLSVSLRQPGLQKVTASSLLASHQKFQIDIEQMRAAASSSIAATLKNCEKKCDYYKLFNGISIKIPRILLGGIASLPYVKKVYPDNKVKINLKDSVPLIGASTVWTKYNDQGDSIVVAILDTGIDYTHPDLGKGIGQGFKVIGGYDFVNKDADPMDDHGHGTHVAGIVAANGKVKGVAPKTLLLAYKVFTSKGEGGDSDILNAIEAAADPNGDNNFDDKADIINMSFGGNGTPDDPLCTASNNAVDLGIICCIASSNDGDFYTVMSPGLAEKAITVGSTEKNDVVSDFSSKGPARISYHVKPEVCAPGSNIVSLAPGNQTATMSGTSMATPHISGVCALLKHLHKDWSPAMIKSAVVNTAKDLGDNVLAQGAGRVNALKAIETKTILSPSVLNFGNDTLVTGLWQSVDTISFSNISQNSQTYSVSIAGVRPGFSLTVSQPVFNVEPGTAQKIIFKCEADNSALPYPLDATHSYSGMITVKGTSDTISIPWSFAKTDIITFKTDIPIGEYCVFSENFKGTVKNPENDGSYYFSEMLLPSGKYKALFTFYKWDTSIFAITPTDMSFIYKDGIDTKTNNHLTINSADASNNIAFSGLTETGAQMGPIESLQNCIALVYSDSASGLNIPLYGNVYYAGYSAKANNLPDNIKLIAAQREKEFDSYGKMRFIQFPAIKNLNGNVTLSNAPADYYLTNFRFIHPVDNNPTRINCGTALLSMKDKKYSEILTAASSTYQGFWGEQIEKSIYLCPSPDKDFYFSTFLTADNTKQYWYKTGTLIKTKDSLGFFNKTAPEPLPCFTSKNDVVIFGEGPAFSYNSYSAEKGAGGYYLKGVNALLGARNETLSYYAKNTKTSYYDSSNRLAVNDATGTISGIFFKNDKYKLVSAHKLYVQKNAPTDGLFTAEFDLSGESPLLPIAISSIRYYDINGKLTARFSKGEKGTISFTVYNPANVNDVDTAATKIYLHKRGSDEWKELAYVSKNEDPVYGLTFRADIGDFTAQDSAVVDMRIETMNKNKMKSEWILSPAFTIGDIIVAVQQEEKPLKPAFRFALEDNYPNPFNPSTTICYTIPVDSRVELKVYDLLGREIKTLINAPETAGSHKAEFNASALSSGIYFYKITAGGFSAVKKMLLMK